MDGHEQKEQLEPVPLPLPQHTLSLQLEDAERTKRRATLLPSINRPHHRISSYTNFSSLRPRSADSSAPQAPLSSSSSTASLLPLFSSTHRITAAGQVVHLTRDEVDALTHQSFLDQDVVLQSRRHEGIAGAGRQRIILLEPLVVHAKVDTGLAGSDADRARHIDDEKEDGMQQPLDAEERSRRRKERTQQRRRERQRQREERSSQHAHSVAEERAEERKEQMEERIASEPDQPHSPSSSLSPAAHARRVQSDLRDFHQQDDLTASLLPSPSSLLSFVAGSDEGPEPSSAVVSAVIQTHVAERVLTHPPQPGDDPTHPSSSLEQMEQLRRREVEHWLHKRMRVQRSDSRLRARQRAEEVLLWSDRRADGDSNSEEQWTSSMRIVVDPADLDSDDSAFDTEDSARVDEDDNSNGEETSSVAARSDLGSPPSDSGELGEAAGAEERVHYALRRIGEEENDDGSRPSSSATNASEHSSLAPSTDQTPRSSSALSRAGSTTGGPSRSQRGRSSGRVPLKAESSAGRRVVRKVKTLMKVRGIGGKTKAEVESALLDVRNARMRRSVVFDPQPVTLDDGDVIDRESVYVHHARDVALVVELLADAHGGGLNLDAPISLLSVPDRGLGGAEQTEEDGGGGASEGRKKAGPTSMLTTVMHGKDMMIVVKWLTQLARSYIVHVLANKAYASESSPVPPPPTEPSVDGSAAPVRAPLPPPLDYLGLDRRTLYTSGFTHERIDQVYSGLYAYSTGFYHLLSGLVMPHLSPPPSELTPAQFMRRLWAAYMRLVELAHPGLYQWVLSCMSSVARGEGDEAFAAHRKEVESSAAVVRGRREEVARLKEEIARTHDAYEDTLDGISEARVTVMSLQEANFREQRQLAEISDESIAEMTAKANRAVIVQQAVYDDSVRVRESRANTVKAIQQARADLHLAHLHHDDMKRLIADRGATNAVLEAEYPPLLAIVQTAEHGAAVVAAHSLTLFLSSFQALCYNQQVQAVVDAQLAWLKQAQKRGLLTTISNDTWDEVRADLQAAYDAAQSALTAHVGRPLVLDGVDVAAVEALIRRTVAESEPLSADLKQKLGLAQFEHESDRRVHAAQARQAASAVALSGLKALLTALSEELVVVHASYAKVYQENDAILSANAELQGAIDVLLARLAQLHPEQSSTRASIAVAQSETDDAVHQCQALPLRIDELRAAIAALIPRQAELNAVETAKGEVYRALLLEKDKLDAEFARSVRDGEELKGELTELETQLGEMEEKALPLWRELDGKLGVLERELEYQRREWETAQMRLCEEEARMQWRVDALRQSEERVRPREAQLREVQAEADAARALLRAEQAVQEAIRLEMRETREQMQAKTRAKDEFLALHIAEAHALQDRKALAIAHIAHLKDVLDHTRSELRASYAVNEQMVVGFDKRLQQWNQQLAGRREALRKKKEMDGQRKDVQLVKRRELQAAVDAAREEFEREDERRRELQETADMMTAELTGEQAMSASMSLEKDRLELFHSELSAAAPILQHELERVMAKDAAFDVRVIERSIQLELEKRAELMRRLAVLEEEDAHRTANRTERWIQTEHSRHFKRVRPEDISERYVLGREMGLMTDEWVKEKQREMREADEREHQREHQAEHQEAVAEAGQWVGNAQRSPLFTSGAERGPTSVGSGGSGVLTPASLWSTEPAARRFPDTLRSSPQAQPSLPLRRKAGSVITVSTQGRARGRSEALRPGQSAKSSHNRTQSSMPATWHQEAVLPDTRPASAGANDVGAEETKETSAGSLSPSFAAGGSRPSSQQSHSRPTSSATRSSSRAVSPMPPHSPQYRVRPRTGKDGNASSRPGTGLSADTLVEMVEKELTSRGLTPKSPLTGEPSSRHPRGVSPLKGAAHHLDGGRSERTDRPRSKERSRSPGLPDHLTQGVMNASTMIPTTALRAAAPAGGQKRSGVRPLSFAALTQQPAVPPSTLSSDALEELYAMTTRTFAINHHRRLTQDERAQEMDAETARVADQAYEHFIVTTQPPQPQPQANAARPDPASGASAASGLQEPAAEVSVLPVQRLKVPGVDGGEGAEALMSGRRAHRGAVHLATLPMTGTLSEWLELQVRNAMELDDHERAPRPSDGPLPHQHLSLMMPDLTAPIQSDRSSSSHSQVPAPSSPSEAEVRNPVVVETGVQSPHRDPRRDELLLGVTPYELPVVAKGPVGVEGFVSPLTGTFFPKKEKAVVPPEERGVVMRAVVPLVAQAEKKSAERVVYEDEMPGRLPNYVKRSLRMAHQRKP